MKKLSFFLMAMLVSLTSFAAALGEGYEKVTNISSLSTGDKVVLYCDASSIGVTGWNNSSDAIVAATGFVEYTVTVVSGGVTLKDESAGKYIAKPTKNHFTYNATAGTCSTNGDGVLTCNSRYLCYNSNNGNYYRMYTAIGSYKPFYVYKVVPTIAPGEANISVSAGSIGFGAVPVTDLESVTPQTLTVEGENMSDKITVALSDQNFTISVTELPAEGGDITIAPATNLEPDTYETTLTLTSGTTTKTVTLTIDVKDVYTITWNALGVTTTTTVVQGSKLVLPEDPTCDYKTFVGWATSEEVNADGSDITFVNDFTIPTASATYYAVFAVLSQDETVEKTGTYTISSYTAGTQYAKNEEHKLDDDVTIYTTLCHFTTELRIYSSSTNNGYAVSNELPGVIKSMSFNAGNKADNLVVFGSTDGEEWEEVGKIATEVDYDDYTLSFGDNEYTYFKLDVEGVNQIRIKSFSITYLTATYTDYSTTCVAPVVTHDFYVENVTVTEGQWSINLSGSWNEQSFIVMLWQDNTQGFGTYAANAETGYSASLGVKELTPTAEGYFMQDPMNENAFIFQGTMTDGTDIYEVYLKGTIASTETGEMEAKNDVSFSCDADGAWTIEAYADDMTWGLYLEVAQDPETMEWIATGYYITDLEASIMEEVQGIGMLYFDDLTGRQVFSATLTTSREQEIYPTLYASSLTLMTNDLMTGESWMGQLNSTSCFEVLLYAADYSWELDLHASNCTGADGTYTIEVIDEAEGAYSTFMGSTIVTGELTIEDGMYEANVTTVDSEGNPAMSISVLAWAAAAEEYDIVINNATVTDNTAGYNIDMIGEWEGHDIKVEVCDELTAETILANFFIDGGIANDGDQAEGTVEATVNEGVVTITGTFECLGSGNVYNVTISGTLPVAEPTTITYELNGGEVLAAVPTNAELWEAFKPYYNTFYGEARADQPITLVATFMTKGEKIFTDATSEYKWLGDYLVKIATEQGYTINSEALWRWHADAFFQANQHTAWPKSADFTEAGKPEAWGPYYQAAHEVVLPTEPVAEDYVLPIPTRTGYVFLGWYDNAVGTGEAYTVIPAGWAGTLYAIWEQGTTTALENIAVEGKAVKAIVNGQLIIIKNGVQYNAQGQVIK